MNVNIFTLEDAKELHNKIDRIIEWIDSYDVEIRSSFLYTNDDLAIKLGVSKRTLQNWRDEGKLTFSQVGRKIFYTQEDLLEFLAKNKFEKF